MPAIKFSGVQSSNPAVKYRAPVAGVVGLYLLGTDEDYTKNRLYGSDGNVLSSGAPVHAAGYSTLTANTNYLTADVPEAAAMTVLAVGRFLDAGTAAASQGWLYGSYSNPLASPSGFNGGVGIYQSAATTVTSTSTRGNGSGGVVSGGVGISVPSPSSWAMYQHQVPASGQSILTNVTAGVTATANVSADPEHKLNNAKLRIGSSYGASYLGRTDVSVLVVSHSIYTADQLLELQSWVRGLAAQQGITV